MVALIEYLILKNIFEFLLWRDIYGLKCIILTIFKYTVVGY